MKKTPRFDLIVLAASADGLAALGRILSDLPPDWRVPLAVVQHRSPKSNLQGILARRTKLPVKVAGDGELLAPGNVYLAHPEWHLGLNPDRTFAWQDGTKIRSLRSSAIPLLSSAAKVLGKRLIAVVLTGAGTDATDGVQSVRERGGVVIAQDPRTSRHAGMPRSAIATGAVHHVLPLEEIGPALRKLVATGKLPKRDGTNEAART